MALRRKAVTRVPKIVWGFNLGTNPDERWPCYRAFWSNPVGIPVSTGINSRLYRKFVHPFIVHRLTAGELARTATGRGRRCTSALSQS